jgi:mannosylglycoprotein endo-beta-mannosidase
MCKCKSKDILKYETTAFEEKYLGLPVPEERMKGSKFKSIKGSISKHAGYWNEKYMSIGAKETLIKSILQSLTTYAMGGFKFPTGLTKELSQIIRNLWWGDEENRRRMHWMSWDK